jgi:hypothetical protein
MSEMDLWTEIKRLNKQIEDLKSIEVPGRWVYLQTPLTSPSWNGNAHSTETFTAINLVSVFGLPRGTKEVSVSCDCLDTGAPGDLVRFMLGPTAPNSYQLINRPPVSKCKHFVQGPVNVVDDKIYYQIGASGVSTMQVWLWIWGYQKP